MNTLIIIILVVFVASLLIGFRRGIVKELGSLCGIVLGLLACRVFGEQATAIAASAMDIKEGSAFSLYAASLVGRGALFLIVWLGVFVVARMLRAAIHAVSLGILDRMLGALFCCVKWNLVLSLLLNLIHIMAPNAGMWTPQQGKGVVDAWLAFAPWLFGTLSDATLAAA